MRIAALVLIAAFSFIRTTHAQTQTSASTVVRPASSLEINQFTIPAGTKFPIALNHAISTRASQEGDAVYAETTFPVVINDRVLIPPGTYVQGRIVRIQRAGRIKGRAEVLMHFTTLIYPSGYTVVLPGALQNAPGVDKANVKDEEGTIREDSQAGDKAAKAGERGIEGAGGGALAGALTTGSRAGAGIGAGIGGAVGVATALFSRGNDIRMDVGTSIEMVIQRDVTLDPQRLAAK